MTFQFFLRHEYLKLVLENISVTFTDIHFSKRTGESITVHLERPNENGFDIAEYVIWEIAREDGEIIADPL